MANEFSTLTPLAPPRIHWHDRALLKIAKLSQTWPLTIAAFIVGTVVVKAPSLSSQGTLHAPNTPLHPPPPSFL